MRGIWQAVVTSVNQRRKNNQPQSRVAFSHGTELRSA
jgi:hypothetical protein